MSEKNLKLAASSLKTVAEKSLGKAIEKELELEDRPIIDVLTEEDKERLLSAIKEIECESHQE